MIGHVLVLKLIDGQVYRSNTSAFCLCFAHHVNTLRMSLMRVWIEMIVITLTVITFRFTKVGGGRGRFHFSVIVVISTHTQKSMLVYEYQAQFYLIQGGNRNVTPP